MSVGRLSRAASLSLTRRHLPGHLAVRMSPNPREKQPLLSVAGAATLLETTEETRLVQASAGGTGGLDQRARPDLVPDRLDLVG